MKSILRFVLFCAVAAVVGFAILGTAQPVQAGCVAQFDINSVTAYRDYIFINFTYDTAGSSPITFTVFDGTTFVGSTTFSSAIPGTYTAEFSLDSSYVQELDALDIDGKPSLGCRTSAIAMATGIYGSKAKQGIHPQCPDGRINYNNCDKIAIYPTVDEDSFGLQVYVVDKKAIPEFVLFVSAADLNALPAHPDEVLVIATSKNGLVTLYKHPNGDYQVNYGPDFEGKFFTFRFNGIPASKYPEVTTFMAAALRPNRIPEIG